MHTYLKMKTYYNPSTDLWAEISQRPANDITALFDVIRPIAQKVREEGDEALKALELKFDNVKLESIAVSEEEMEKAADLIPASLKDSIKAAYENIKRFHEAQRFTPIEVETAPGVVCQQRSVPIEKVGLYVPGGSAPLFSTVLMLAVPAQIAGCKEIVLCTPPSRNPEDACSVNPAILFAAKLCGITKVYRLGGAQAVFAMSYGTDSVVKVDKLFGPGNQYVMAAKQLVSLQGVAIDMPAGPSEVEVIADNACVPAFVAADLLSQAEHGPDSQVILCIRAENKSEGEALAEAINTELESQLAALPRKDIALKALSSSRVVIFDSTENVMTFTNQYAPEHLIIATKDYNELAQQVTCAGSVFLGNYACESAGDYASGTNHTLPTLGYARNYSGLCLDSFQRKMTLQTLSAEGIRSIGQTVVEMARAEQLDAHANAMKIRMEMI